MTDPDYMRRALRLAAKSAGRTSPNPMVGAVLVKRKRLVAEGYHKKAGQPHAEALVLEEAAEKARGATLYVTLEPCCHMDKRTPPCTRAILETGVKKVVIATIDPNPKVAGKGISILKANGVDVSVGVLENEAKELNRAYFKYITEGMPYVILKSAMTLDGKIATPEGQSQWISCEASRRVVHRLRGRVDAVLTAIGTVMADDPRLTSRIRGAGPDPLRVVIDPNLEIPFDARLITERPPETLIVTKTKNARLRRLAELGIQSITYKGRLDLKWLMGELAKTAITSVLIEGGASLNAHAFRDGIVDRVLFVIAPKIIGGTDSLTPVGGSFFKRLDECYRIERMKARTVGDDIHIEGDVIYP